jgi:folate-binding protein YgfZ
LSARNAYRIRAAGVIDVAGPDRTEFLQGQLTQDVSGMASGDVRPAAGLTPKGKLIYVARLLALPDRFRLLLPEPLRQTVRDHLAKYAAFQKITVEDRSAAFLRVGIYSGSQQPPGRDRWHRLPADGEFSAEILAPAADREEVVRQLEAIGFASIDPQKAEALRVEAGRPRFGQDFDGTHLPDEVGLQPAISTTKGCYVGQEVVARLRTYGRVNRRLVGFSFPEGALPAGSQLRRPEDPDPGRIEWGRVTSSSVSERLGPVGLGFAFREVPEGARLVAVADPDRSAVVAALPFG